MMPVACVEIGTLQGVHRSVDTAIALYSVSDRKPRTLPCIVSSSPCGPKNEDVLYTDYDSV